jgi:hypothetical protein
MKIRNYKKSQTKWLQAEGLLDKRRRAPQRRKAQKSLKGQKLLF